MDNTSDSGDGSTAAEADVEGDAAGSVAGSAPGSVAGPVPGSVAGSVTNCVFCGIVAGRIPSAKVAEDELTLAFMDIDPGSEGHLLVIPKRHSADLFDISAEDLTATTLAAQRISRAALTALGAEGVNLLNCAGQAAWQTVYHFHMHVIPRYSDKSRDRLELPYEPGQTADLDAIAERALRLAAELANARPGSSS